MSACESHRSDGQRYSHVTSGESSLRLRSFVNMAEWSLQPRQSPCVMVSAVDYFEMPRHERVIETARCAMSHQAMRYRCSDPLAMTVTVSITEAVLDRAIEHSPHTMVPVLARTSGATLECELLDRSRFPTPADARREVFGCIEGFYNTRRIHSALGYESPANFERLNHAAEAKVQRRGDRSAPEFSWLFASSTMYVASLTGMTREKRNHIRHHQPQKPTVRESGVAPNRVNLAFAPPPHHPTRPPPPHPNVTSGSPIQSPMATRFPTPLTTPPPPPLHPPRSPPSPSPSAAHSPPPTPPPTRPPTSRSAPPTAPP